VFTSGVPEEDVSPHQKGPESEPADGLVWELDPVTAEFNRLEGERVDRGLAGGEGAAGDRTEPRFQPSKPTPEAKP
jgi:hypothetical protein